MPPKIDLLGKKFGRLTVVSESGRSNAGKVMWDCLCDCGNSVLVCGSDLRNGHTCSCGCLGQEHRQIVNTKHGGKCRGNPDKLYSVWMNMKARCHNRNNSHYKYYGGRGIIICDEWKDYAVFKEWALSHSYVDNLTIDRIDNDGNYCPGNCRWVTISEQARNKRDRVSKYTGNRTSVAKLARANDRIPHTVHSRLLRGWSLDRALKEPV